MCVVGCAFVWCVRCMCKGGMFSFHSHCSEMVLILTATISCQVDLFEAALANTEVSRMILLSELCIPIAPMKEVLFQLWREEKVRRKQFFFPDIILGYRLGFKVECMYINRGVHVLGVLEFFACPCA